MSITRIEQFHDLLNVINSSESNLKGGLLGGRYIVTKQNEKFSINSVFKQMDKICANHNAKPLSLEEKAHIKEIINQLKRLDGTLTSNSFFTKIKRKFGHLNGDLKKNILKLENFDPIVEKYDQIAIKSPKKPDEFIEDRASNREPTNPAVDAENVNQEQRDAQYRQMKMHLDQAIVEFKKPDSKEAALNHAYQAAELGNANALVIIACYYKSGAMVEKDEAKAAELFEQAALRYGHTGANYLIGMAYRDGQGVPQSDSLSFNFMKVAADRRVPEAELVISSYYLCGKGVPQSTKIGLIYLKRAADGGMKAAQQTLAKMHREGKFIRQSNSTAKHYETLAVTATNSITNFAIVR